jgi:hypothetical protein
MKANGLHYKSECASNELLTQKFHFSFTDFPIRHAHRAVMILEKTLEE